MSNIQQTKNSQKKFLGSKFGSKGPKLGPNQFFFFFQFLKFGSLVFLEIAYSDSLEQCITSSRDKTHKKNFRDQIWDKTDQNHTQNQVFYHFLRFGSLVFLKIAQDDSLEQYLTTRRVKTRKRKQTKKIGDPNMGQAGQNWSKVRFFAIFSRWHYQFSLIQHQIAASDNV